MKKGHEMLLKVIGLMENKTTTQSFNSSLSLSNGGALTEHSSSLAFTMIRNKGTQNKGMRK